VNIRYYIEAVTVHGVQTLQNKGFSFRTVSKNTRNGYRTPPTTPFFERQGRFHPVNGYKSPEPLCAHRRVAGQNRVDVLKDGLAISRQSAFHREIVGGVIGAEYGIGGFTLGNDDAQLTQQTLDARHLEAPVLGKPVNRRGGDEHQGQGGKELRVHSRGQPGGARTAVPLVIPVALEGMIPTRPQEI
jgi:hypothetical protein